MSIFPSSPTSSATASSSPTESPPTSISSNTHKPKNPYAVGRELKLKKHVPPKPFGLNYSSDGGADTEEVEGYSQLDWCLSHPPKLGLTNDDDIKHVHIVQALRCGEASGAQILLVRDASFKGQFVAKIYDPLYYSFEQGDSWISYRVSDVVARADADYAAEAAAYNELESTPFSGTLVPRFYGTWIFDTHTKVNGIEHVRQVRMILMEHVEGVRMEDVDATKLTEDEKNNMMIKLVEGESELSFHGIEHNDIAPRNVIIGPPVCLSGMRSEASRNPPSARDSVDRMKLFGSSNRVCLIDFNLSTVDRLKSSYDPLQPHQRLSPVMRWWSKINEFRRSGWVPPDEKKEWLWSHWEHSDGKYVDAERNPNNPYVHPMPVGRRASFEAKKAAKASQKTITKQDP
ncbi:hypothetical protein K491DRAFT_759071 [Lophiostoma macrostomum CBS 122681]|uniref:non-specific serine/threonine protein kinase n=1 Tax=Lophiostoma macrostomum CBS 122681 TaxID=1314788 RepID=A0A6A6T3V4_9PLEO|nr:hypothetical protein K491DRAFT_759071 [Lophiostoma macrostomum CBS 122681]